jgi:hypothetical protein
MALTRGPGLLTSRKARISNETPSSAAVTSQPDQLCDNPRRDSSGRPSGSQGHGATGLISLVNASAEPVAASVAVAVTVAGGPAGEGAVAVVQDPGGR